MIEVLIILGLFLGVAIGFKRGAIKSLVSLIATIVFIIIAWKLKTPLANFLIKICPFFKFNGTMFEGVTVLNIIIYECIAFFLIFSILAIILNIIIKASGILEKVLDSTIILGLPFKIIGAILGIIEMYIVIFIAMFVLLQLNIATNYIKNSSLANSILNNSPVLSKLVANTYTAFDEIYELHSSYYSDKDRYNKEALDILLKYNIINKNTVVELIEKDKINIKNVDDILNKYEEDN